MALPPNDDRRPSTRSGTARMEETGRAPVDSATRRPSARSDVRQTELKQHRGGSTLWIVLAAVLALLLAFWLFSDWFSSDPAVGIDGGVGTVVPGGGALPAAPAVPPSAAGDVDPTAPVVAPEVTTAPDVTIEDGAVEPAAGDATAPAAVTTEEGATAPATIGN